MLPGPAGEASSDALSAPSAGVAVRAAVDEDEDDSVVVPPPEQPAATTSAAANARHVHELMVSPSGPAPGIARARWPVASGADSGTRARRDPGWRRRLTHTGRARSRR